MTRGYGDINFSVEVVEPSHFSIDYDTDKMPAQLIADFTALGDDLWGICDEEMRDHAPGKYEVVAVGCYLDIDEEYSECGPTGWAWPILCYEQLLVKEIGRNEQYV